MNTQTPGGQAPGLMDPDTAYDTVCRRVYAPVFFQKLATDYNIPQPETDEEARTMLLMAGQLREAHDHQQKLANARNNPLAAAKAHLDKQLTKMGFAVQKQAVATAGRVKQAAAEASYDPELAHAILSLQAGAAGITL